MDCWELSYNSLKFDEFDSKIDDPTDVSLLK